jgi:UPF0755 protein
LLAVLGLLGALGWLFVIYPDTDGPASEVEEVIIDVSEGMTLGRLAKELKSQGIIKDSKVWSVYMRMRGLDRHLRQGKVRFRVPMTPEEVARHATTRLGRIQVRILIPEGFSRFEIAKRLEEYGVCGADDFLDATEDASLLASYGVEANDAEGYLFPDTYEFDDQTRPGRVVERMLANWTRKYEEIREQYANDLHDLNGWTTHDIVTLASIVEKEAAVPSERARIAGVFLNRLKSKRFLPRRRLQADPMRRSARSSPLLRRLRRSHYPGHAGRPRQSLQYIQALGTAARPDQQSGEGCDRCGHRLRRSRILLLRCTRQRASPLQ